MPELADVLDPYARKARLLPAFLVTMPIGITLAVLLPAFSYEYLVAIAVGAGLPLFITNVVRSLGRRRETKLIRAWDGLPTTKMLRLRDPDNNPHLLRLRRQRISQLLQEILPSLAEESAAPEESDNRYTAVTRRLIARVREQQTHFALVQTENAYYGFRRNLLGLKPVALAVLGALVVADGLAVITGHSGWVAAAALGAFLVVLIVTWIFVIRPAWVFEQGQTYAERLFDALEEPTFVNPPAS